LIPRELDRNLFKINYELKIPLNSIYKDPTGKKKIAKKLKE